MDGTLPCGWAPLKHAPRAWLRGPALLCRTYLRIQFWPGFRLRVNRFS
jgi:hypothetical protein